MSMTYEVPVVINEYADYNRQSVEIKYFIRKRMIEDQHGFCTFCAYAIEEEPEYMASIPVNVDHDHRTGKIRGVVHPQCNNLIARMEAAIDGRKYKPNRKLS